MELRVLRYFLAVIDEGSMTAAAASVRVAQPSLSRQLRQLEASLGTDLFDRSHRQMRLTAAGRQFLPLARDLVERADAAAAAIRTPAAMPFLNLIVAATRITVADVILPFIATLGPDALRVTVRESRWSEVFNLVRSGAADLGVSAAPPPASLATRPIGRFGISAQVAPGHPWGNRPSIPLEELVSEPLLLPSVEHVARRLFDQAVAAAGLKYRLAGESPVTEAVQTLAAGSTCVAVVADDARFGLHSLAIDVNGEDLSMRLVAGWDGSHYAAAEIAAWAERLAAFVILRYGEGASPTPGRRASSPLTTE